MPQRRAFSPSPMNQPTTGHTGRATTAPNLAPAPQPLPPVQQPQQQQPQQAMSGPMAMMAPMTSSSSASPMMAPPPQRPMLPSSIPLQPAQPQSQPMSMGASPSMGGTGTVDALDVQPFLHAEEMGSQFGGVMNGDRQQENFHLPHESKTTAADLQDDGGEGDLPMTLLKLLGAMGGR